MVSLPVINNKGTFLKIAAVIWMIGATMLPGSSQGKDSLKKPNFLLILADDMGLSDAACYGGEIATPHLDKMADNGLRFTQMYSTGRCWPSRACLLTGYYAQQVRMDPPFISLPTNEQKATDSSLSRLPEWARLASHHLKPAGYRSYHSGKWHIRVAPKQIADGGFDRSYRLRDHNRFFSPQVHQEDDKPLPIVSPGSAYYATTAIADYAIKYLKEHQEKFADQPFFQYLAFTAPHFPLHALQKDIDRYRGKYLMGWDAVRQSRWQRMRKMGIIDCELSPLQPKTLPGRNLEEDELKERIGIGEVERAVPWDTLTDEQKAFQATKMAIHAAMIDRMDREIGRVLEQLKSMGAYENTLILFLSDNGASAEIRIKADDHDPSAAPGSWRSYLCLGPGWSTAANTPFRYHKRWIHEGGISSPFIVHWPAGLKARGELRHTPGHFIDVLPTLLDLAGILPSSTWKGNTVPPFPGRSLVSALEAGGSLPRESLFFHHRGSGSDPIGSRGIRMDDWKLVAVDPSGPWELYNLKKDRSELNNLAGKYPGKVREMSKAWERKERSFKQLAGTSDWMPDK